MIGEVLGRLKVVDFVGRKLFKTLEDQEDFISFCGVEFFKGRSLTTSVRLLYCDYIRQQLRNRRTPSLRPKFTEIDINHIQAPSFEASINRKIDQQKIVALILKSLNLRDRLILEFYFFDDFSLKDIADIFEISEQAVSLKLTKILNALRTKFSGVDNLITSV